MGRKKRTDEEALQLRAIIKDWKIDFESATTLGDWDAKELPSRHIFKQILEIKTVTFVAYPPQGHSNEQAAIQKKLLVRRLQANAARCRSEKDNEAGWVNNVANLVFECLNGVGFQCQVCNAYLWLPDFVARPEDPVAAERLLRKYRRRKICRCSGAERADAAPLHPDSVSIFSNKSDERVIHNNAGLKHVMLDQKYKRPDRVFGLSITGSFDRFRDRLSMYSPFVRKHTLFPFMVVEAKSEKSENGFHDIEQQTALSIRTCLKIQTDLEMNSNQVLDPLVWFFGFRGDEWRLYVALPVNDRTKVIDCWHGCISNTDEALQLLLIVDWICFWARDVHRKGVLECLSRLEARETTPAATLLSSQGASVAEESATRSSSLVIRSSRPVNANPEDSAQHNMTIPVGSAYEPEDEVMQDALNNVSSDHEGGEGGSTAVRSARDVAFRWKCFALPEDDDKMLECLSTLGSGGCIQNAARTFWDLLTDNSSTVKMSLKSISDLLYNTIEDDAIESAALEPVSTFLACQRRLTETSWQVMCTYWCITCSQRAAQLLAKMAGISDAEVYPLNLWRAHDCNCLVSAVADFQRLSGKATAAAAISQEIYYVRASTSRSSACHMEWCKNRGDTIQPRIALLEALFMHVESAQHPSLPLATSRASDGDTQMPPQLFATEDLNMVPGVILKKPDLWPATCPLWCFLTFELGGRESIGRQITLALRQKAIYAAGSLEPSDEQFIQEWAMAMKDVMQSVDAPND